MSIKLWWEKRIPFADGSSVVQRREEDELVIEAYAPGDPPAPPPPPDTTGTAEGTIGDHRYSVDWQYKDGQFAITDLDVVLSLDDEIG